jgi:hypothetical protein
MHTTTDNTLVSLDLARLYITSVSKKPVLPSRASLADLKHNSFHVLPFLSVPDHRATPNNKATIRPSLVYLRSIAEAAVVVSHLWNSVCHDT